MTAALPSCGGAVTFLASTRGNYLFNCQCSRCLSEADQPDVTSEEEMDDGDEEEEEEDEDGRQDC